MSSSQARARRGIVLLVVLIAIAMIGFVALAFSEHMLVEVQCTAQHNGRAELLWAAHSASQQVAAQIDGQAAGTDQALTIDGFQELNTDKGRHAIRYATVHPKGMGSTELRFGPLDLSARLNINHLATLPPQQGRQRLMKLGGITMQQADAILDFIDADDELRPLGAETSYYQTIDATRSAKNAPLTNLSELLQVRGISPELLYAEDSNANGWLDKNENDGEHSFPPDDADRQLNSGLSGLLTVDSKESNFRRDGTAKIHLNQKSLVTLYDQLNHALGPTAARFIVAYRMEGSLELEEELEYKDHRSAKQRVLDAERRARRQLGLEDDSDLFAESVERGGIELTNPGIEIRSLIELFGVAIRMEIEGEDEILDSPWSSLPQAIESNLPALDAILTVSDTPYQTGRINPASCPIAVLLTVPGITPQIARATLDYRRSQPELGGYKTIAWLRQIPQIDPALLRKLAPFLTSGGDVWSAYSIGYSERNPMVEVSFVRIDASMGGQSTIRLLHQWAEPRWWSPQDQRLSR